MSAPVPGKKKPFMTILNSKLNVGGVLFLNLDLFKLLQVSCSEAKAHTVN